MSAPRSWLDGLTVASPCSVSWADMHGDDRVRFCARCSLHVYNLSALTREAAKALVNEKEGRLCTRFYRRADGAVLTADCPHGRRRRPAIRLLACAAAVATTHGDTVSRRRSGHGVRPA
jgi:hypothetical protein